MLNFILKQASNYKRICQKLNIKHSIVNRLQIQIPAVRIIRY